MTSLFFYGTLCHLPLLELVLGRSDIALRPAQLDDFGAYWAKAQIFPLIMAEPGAQTQGVLCQDLTQADIERLNYYEGGFAYDLHDVTLVGGIQTQVYIPQQDRWSVGAAWSLGDWVAQHGALTLEAASEVMSRYGQSDRDDIQAQFPFIRSRAWARVLGRDTAPQNLRAPVGQNKIKIASQPDGFDGFFRLRRVNFSHQRFDGDWSPEMAREVYVSYDAALVLPYDPVLDCVLLVEQMRLGPIVRGDPAVTVLEPIAGMVDAGEDPSDTARREAIEEAGLGLSKLDLIAKVYASPGYATDFFHCYLGSADLAGKNGHLGGHLDENEDIRSHVVPFDQAMELLKTGEINVAPLAMMLLWLAQNRDQLRATA